MGEIYNNILHVKDNYGIALGYIYWIEYTIYREIQVYMYLIIRKSYRKIHKG